MPRARKKIPDFQTDEEAAEFWDTHDFTDYEHEMEVVDNVTFPRPRLKRVSLRLAASVVKEVKRIAADQGLPYGRMLRMWITERERKEEDLP